jgi:hypothetical protein
MNKKIVFTLAATLAVMGVAGLGMYANAYQGNMTTRAPWFSQDRYDAMQDAFLNDDYDAWKKLMSDQMGARKNWMLTKITSDNFPKFAEMHRLMKEGKIDEARKIRAELGLPERGQRTSKRGCARN